jgi:tRNA A37 threonylcarbamoyladenosine dehydratase
MEEEQIEAIKQDPEALKVYLRQYYKNMNPNAEETEVEDFVTTQTAEYSYTVCYRW